MDPQIQSFREWLKEADWDGHKSQAFAQVVLAADDPTFPDYPLQFEPVKAYLVRRGEHDRKLAKEGREAWLFWLEDIRHAHPLIPVALAAYQRLVALDDPADESLRRQLRLALLAQRVDVDGQAH
jgi:hypothetical protein